MEKYLFMRPLLALLAQDRFICRVVAIALKTAAVLLVLCSLTTFFMAGKLIFELPANGILGGVLFEAFFIIAVYAGVHTLLIRAEQINDIPPGSNVMLRITPLLLRGLSEAYAAFVGLIAVGGGIFVWFTSLSLTKVLNPAIRGVFPGIGSDTSFAGGIGFMVSGVAVAMAVLFVAYLLAEIVAVVTRSLKTTEPAMPARTTFEERFRSRVG